MTSDCQGPQQTICIFCLAKRDRRTGETYRNCDLCVGRSNDRWCECTLCPWIIREETP